MRVCAHCSSFWKKQGLLCESCWQTLQACVGERLTVLNQGYDISSLLDWTDKKIIHSLLYGLKSDGKSAEDFSTTHDRLAAWFLARGPNFSYDSILVPAPSRSGRIDHAMSFALALQKLTGLQSHPLLKRATMTPQKSLSKTARADIRFELNLSKNQSVPGKIIFVDDVITTGNTARAAYIALERPSSFHVWTIGCRKNRVLL